MGFVLLSGLFEPQTAVELVQVPDEATVHASYGQRVGRRLVDEEGNIGFDGLEEGARFLAVGFDVYGKALEVRCRTLTEADEIRQPPITPEEGKVGTQETVPPEQAPGEPDAILQSGVPDGVPIETALAG